MRRRILGLIIIFWGASILIAPYIPAEWSKYRRSNLLNYSLTSILLSIFNVLLLIIGLRIFIKGKKG